MFTVSQWATPLFDGSASSTPATGSAPSPALHAEALLEGSRSPSPVYSRRSSMLEEDTFTVGGVYIGSLQSHIRVSTCTGQEGQGAGDITNREGRIRQPHATYRYTLYFTQLWSLSQYLQIILLSSAILFTLVNYERCENLHSSFSRSTSRDIFLKKTHWQNIFSFPFHVNSFSFHNRHSFVLHYLEF